MRAMEASGVISDAYTVSICVEKLLGFCQLSVVFVIDLKCRSTYV